MVGFFSAMNYYLCLPISPCYCSCIWKGTVFEINLYQLPIPQFFWLTTPSPWRLINHLQKLIMKKFYLFFRGITLIFFLSLSSLASSQICGSILENFDNTGNSTAGFTGDFVYEKPAANGYLIKRAVIPNGLYTVTTPTYKLLPGATYVGFGFVIGGTEKVARAEAVITYSSTLNNQITNVIWWR